MSDSELDLDAPELAADDVLRIDDPYFSTDTVAIVTGAASGIGRATAVALAENGLTVVGADIDEEGLAGTADAVTEFESEGQIVACPSMFDAARRASRKTASNDSGSGSCGAPSRSASSRSLPSVTASEAPSRSRSASRSVAICSGSSADSRSARIASD